jgi:hypothetical protein
MGRGTSRASRLRQVRFRTDSQAALPNRERTFARWSSTRPDFPLALPPPPSRPARRHPTGPPWPRPALRPWIATGGVSASRHGVAPAHGSGQPQPVSGHPRRPAGVASELQDLGDSGPGRTPRPWESRARSTGRLNGDPAHYPVAPALPPTGGSAKQPATSPVWCPPLRLGVMAGLGQPSSTPTRPSRPRLEDQRPHRQPLPLLPWEFHTGTQRPISRRWPACCWPPRPSPPDQLSFPLDIGQTGDSRLPAIPAQDPPRRAMGAGTSPPFTNTAYQRRTLGTIVQHASPPRWPTPIPIPKLAPPLYGRGTPPGPAWPTGAHLAGRVLNLDPRPADRGGAGHEGDITDQQDD